MEIVYIFAGNLNCGASRVKTGREFMGKLPRFLVCENAQAKSSGLFVLHTKFPSFLAMVIERDGEIEDFGKIMEQYEVAARTNRIGDCWYILAVVKWFDEIELVNQADADQLAKVMSRMGDWFFAYVKKSYEL